MSDVNLSALARVVQRFRATASTLEPERMDGGDAVAALQLMVEAERVCGAARARLARRVDETKVWRAGGHRSAAHWLAAQAGTSVGAAVEVLSTAARLEECPRTAQAFQAGRLSEAQASVISHAAAADPTAETGLLDAAQDSGLVGLRERCRSVRAAADPGWYERIHRSRWLRCWTDADGAGRGAWRLTPDDHARVTAALDAHTTQIFTTARRGGRRETQETYAADALVALADGVPAQAAGVKVVVHHDPNAQEPERCEIPGVGPIPAAVAARFATDAVITALTQDGHDITRVAHLGRTIPANLRRALETRDPICAVPGCEQRHGLEIDHITPFALGGPASLENLVRLCRFHHHQKHHDGYQIQGSPGDWTWSPPRRAEQLAHAPP